ncbi:hypothetical protein DICPUDRAFT_52080 [Dictyostelium purpureum]|uniref:Lipid desaturase domain-containing protein n=1 Tax=Dictyostelium purpureum TaxID=5786 RepID=F0Z6P8_DICPU|nr:uncharacterized protein DICPUDRAFT_52080 [Dictyostelium purpureum]EGC40347.1 hypothetical protein DICPUDRAFT_52080 [Dictyostelium purpureum]|eukprot:XP_003283098.1 hypothetical protein DICPUDRAFT_52080 [Dictyostelium purpureum]
MTLVNMVHHTLPAIQPTATKDGSGVCEEIIKESLYPILGQKANEVEFEQKQQQQQQQQQNNINNDNNKEFKEFKQQETQQDLYKISKKDKSEDLKNRYTSTKRNQEIISVTLFAVFLGISIYRMLTWYFVKNIWIFLSSSVLAMFAADFFSGIVHWAADTWGSLDTPLVGNSFIRSFREHHVAPVAMTKHDVIETNGDNCMLTVPILAFTAFAKISTNTAYDMFIFSFLVNLCFWVSLTNQIHKWSHTYNVHPIVGFLQRNGIILSKRDHAIHHRNPFDKFYCITNGWLNPWLASIGFWKRLENVITLLTGAIPRADDQAWTS